MWVFGRPRTRLIFICSRNHAEGRRKPSFAAVFRRNTLRVSHDPSEDPPFVCVSVHQSYEAALQAVGHEVRSSSGSFLPVRAFPRDDQELAFLNVYAELCCFGVCSKDLFLRPRLHDSHKFGQIWPCLICALQSEMREKHIGLDTEEHHDTPSTAGRRRPAPPSSRREWYNS